MKKERNNREIALSLIFILLGAVIMMNGEQYGGMLIIAIGLGISSDVREYTIKGLKLINSQLPILFGHTNTKMEENTQTSFKSPGSIQIKADNIEKQIIYGGDVVEDSKKTEKVNPEKESKKIDLKLYFDESKTYHIRPIGNTELKGRFLHVVVRNEDEKEIVKNCKGELVELNIVTDTEEYPHPYFTGHLILHWANMIDPRTREILYDPKDILPRDDILLDVCHTVENEALFYVFTPHVPNGIQKDFPRGDYHIKIRVYGDNTNLATGEFLIHFDGNWEKITMEPYKSKSGK